MGSFDHESGPIGLPHISTEEYRSINQGNIAQNNEINEKTVAVNTPVDIANDSVVSFVQTSLTHGKTDSTSEETQRVEAPTAVSTGSEIGLVRRGYSRACASLRHRGLEQ
ncbi:unnamed protein product [Parnassius apollo]|uniref:(apollo) hypothetical protein n=1 Tax=Parnassius apollo TaxID=110799 RepID=A0A8S3W3B7_PARAO|nr:unnamed protein product [Parnassius apollo]